jgi:hypothetical protein
MFLLPLKLPVGTQCSLSHSPILFTIQEDFLQILTEEVGVRNSAQRIGTLLKLGYFCDYKIHEQFDTIELKNV